MRGPRHRALRPAQQPAKWHGGLTAGLSDLFRKADERYNSGLFHFHKEKDRAESPDELTPTSTSTTSRSRTSSSGLYYPDSPYEFSVLPADILGQVYEQFLGKVIRLTAGHRAKVEDKPEVKKAGGVYYTPTYIVDYIVKNTVGKLLEGKTPKQAAKLPGPRPRLRLRLVPAGRLPVPARLAPRLVHRRRARRSTRRNCSRPPAATGG